MLSGDNGILQKATDAKAKTERQSVVEQARTDVLGYQAKNIGGDLEKTQLKAVLDTYFKDAPDLTDMSDTEIKEKQLQTLPKYGTHTITVSEIYNGNLKSDPLPVTGNLSADEKAGLPNGVIEIAKEDVTNATIKNNDNIRAVITGEVPIPNGFYYVGGTKDDGIVISDNVADSGKGTSHTVAQTLIGNQFVWVPVPNSSDFNRYDGYSYGSIDEFSSSCSEPCENGYSTEPSEYTAMYNSVINNKGFYVARYEASQGENGAESKQGKTVLQVMWGIESNNIGTTGAVYKSQQMYTGKTEYGVTSTLIYGIQWDAIMYWIDSAYKTGECDVNTSYVANSTGKGNYSSENYASTGSSSDYAVKNIYDLAGNMKEWTMESYGSYKRIARGGGFGSAGLSQPVSCRQDYRVNDDDWTFAFRITLHL